MSPQGSVCHCPVPHKPKPYKPRFSALYSKGHCPVPQGPEPYMPRASMSVPCIPRTRAVYTKGQCNCAMYPSVTALYPKGKCTTVLYPKSCTPRVSVPLPSTPSPILQGSVCQCPISQGSLPCTPRVSVPLPSTPMAQVLNAKGQRVPILCIILYPECQCLIALHPKCTVSLFCTHVSVLSRISRIRVPLFCGHAQEPHCPRCCLLTSDIRSPWLGYPLDCPLHQYCEVVGNFPSVCRLK